MRSAENDTLTNEVSVLNEDRISIFQPFCGSKAAWAPGTIPTESGTRFLMCV